MKGIVLRQFILMFTLAASSTDKWHNLAKCSLMVSTRHIDRSFKCFALKGGDKNKLPYLNVPIPLPWWKNEHRCLNLHWKIFLIALAPLELSNCWGSLILATFPLVSFLMSKGWLIYELKWANIVVDLYSQLHNYFKVP